ncbi:MAG: hypothetical protein R6U31_07860 [bacterium]
MRNRLLFFAVLFIIMLASAIFITIHYDIYAYHLWTYTATGNSVSQLYNPSHYFSNVCSYPPLGAYMYILPGKIMSYISPLKVNSVPLIFLYKIIPLLILIVFIWIYPIGARIHRWILVLPIIVSTLFGGSLDIVILALMFAGLKSLERDKLHMGLLLLIIPVFIKQTAFFISLALIIHYFFRTKQWRVIAYSALHSILVFIIVYFPMIIRGSVIMSLQSLFKYTLLSSPLSGLAFNLYSLLPNAHLMDFNYKLGPVSIKTISIGMILLTIILLSYVMRKRSTAITAVIFSIIWFNFMVGLRNQHILYPLFFLMTASHIIIVRRLAIIYSIIALVNILSTSSVFMMNVFSIPVAGSELIISLSALQVIISVSVIYILSGQHDLRLNSVPLPRTIYIYASVVLFTFLISVMPGYIDRSEKSLVKDIIQDELLIDYSRNRYIEPNVISLSPFENFLGIRISHNAFFTFLSSDMKNMRMKAYTEFTDSGVLDINGKQYEISSRPVIINTILQSDTVTVHSRTEPGYNQIAIYNIEYE